MPASQKRKRPGEDMRAEYHFSPGVRGKRVSRWRAARMSWSSIPTSRKSSERRKP
jgi:hypothetical protein